eukprot:896149-Rhodomonas_salina.2
MSYHEPLGTHSTAICHLHTRRNRCLLHQNQKAGFRRVKSSEFENGGQNNKQPSGMGHTPPQTSTELRERGDRGGFTERNSESFVECNAPNRQLGTWVQKVPVPVTL